MTLIVTIAGQDVTEYVNEVDTISRGTDYPYATETSPSTCNITLSDPEGDFAPNNPSNFFVENSQPQNGKKAPIFIRKNGKTIFIGEVDEVSQDVPESVTVIEGIDLSRKIRESKLVDFGLSKSFKMIPDAEAGDVNGIYPLTCGVTPVSDESFSGGKALNTPFNVVDSIKEAGVLDPDNVAIIEDNLVSEGGLIPVAAGGAYPQADIKSPYRYRYVIRLIAEILEHYGITSRSLQVLPESSSLHFTPYGRPGYESIVGELGSSNELSWFGYVTDYLVDGNTFYFAYTVNRGQAHQSRILRYNRTTDVWDVFYTVSGNGTEIWGLAKLGNRLVMLVTYSSNVSGTDRPAVGSYDSNIDSNVALRYFDLTHAPPQTPSTIVNRSSSYPPQLAHFYAIGSKIPYVIPVWERVALPDTRRRLIVHNNQLFYGYAKNGVAGLAKVSIGQGIPSPTSVMQFASDGKNHAGFAYDIDGSTIRFATTFYTSTGSTLKLVRNV